MTINCLICKKEFKAHHKNPRFCSYECYGAYRRGKDFGLDKKIEKRCLYCNSSFKVSPCRKESANYCSRKCTYQEHGKKVSGEKSHLWRGGIAQDGRNSNEYRAWRLAVIIRDGGVCHMCWTRTKKPNANHIKKWSNYPELRFDIKNGITLCEHCHRGAVNRHEEEWESFFTLIGRLGKLWI